MLNICSESGGGGEKRKAGVLSAETLKSRDAAFQHLTVDMLTKPSFITDSQP